MDSTAAIAWTKIKLWSLYHNSNEAIVFFIEAELWKKNLGENGPYLLCCHES